jgi:hypothetical protein
LIWLERKVEGFYTDAIGWNGNTGAAAINLALIMGARRIYLLGFDMDSDADALNWYDGNERPPTPDMIQQWREKTESSKLPAFKHFEKIINLNPRSCLDCFEKADWHVLKKAV